MKKKYKSFAINGILIIIAMVASYSASRMVRNAFFARQQSDQMVQRIEELQQKKKELEAQLAEMQTKESVERQAKERLNLKKPGEEVVVVVPQKEEKKPQEKSPTLWEKITSFFIR